MDTEGTEVVCARCGETKPRLEQQPIPGKLGAVIHAKTCAECWEEWRLMEVRVINELRLNFMDPESETKLHAHLREFLKLD